MFVDLLRQRVDVGVFELGYLAVLRYQVDNRMLAAQLIKL
jgi:hypothetical protein